MKRILHLVILPLLLPLPIQAALEPTPALLSSMPRVEDYTLMFWAEGFPAHIPGTRWRRVIQTGTYAMALDTYTLQVPHFGIVPGGVSYPMAVRDGDAAWQKLPPAVLNLNLRIGNQVYHATAGRSWTDFTGPRLIESGRFVQRADVTDLVFTAEDGAKLNAEARLETIAWPDRLGLILAARPGLQPIAAGDACFGRVGGGFGLDSTNHLEIPHAPALDPEQFTLELWAFVPTDYQASRRTFPWLVCKNHHEQAEGNYGIVFLNGKPQARLNIGGGRANQFHVDAPVSALKLEAWNHLALSYDGEALRFYVNGQPAGERHIGRRRVPGQSSLAFGRRQDGDGDGYPFRGVVDEIRLYDRALTSSEIAQRFAHPEVAQPALRPLREWSFRADGIASPTRPSEAWTAAAMEVSLSTPNETLRQRWTLPPQQSWRNPQWHEVALTLDPVAGRAVTALDPVKVSAREGPAGKDRPVEYDLARAWHRVNLDGIEPLVPAPAEAESQNDALERIQLVLVNPTGREQTARLLFEKTADGFRQRIGSSVTGMSAVLRDPDGQATGIPVQLSKNWHTRPEGGVYAGLWFHGFSHVRLPPGANLELELTLAYGHWGGVAAASHAQLCLIGWGSNQLWDQSALGSWGESLCYEPDQVQAQAGILDVRPVMVRSMSGDQPWQWTHNVGGGDYFRFFDPAGRRVLPAGMRTAYERQGPCLTEVTYAGRLGEGLRHAATVSLARTDDLVRGLYRLRLEVTQATEFSRFVLFQIGADTYSYTGERKMALGNETGLLREWQTQWGSDTYRTAPMECSGRVPWLSLHEAVSRADQEARNKGEKDAPGAWANRGIVIRAWQARLGGKPAAPWAVERGVRTQAADTSTMDLVPPPDVTRLEPGDYVDATIEHIVMPQFAADYYGPNEALRAALQRDENTWRMIHREAVGNDRRVSLKTGRLVRLHPAITVSVEDDAAEFTLAGGLGYVPVTFTGLTSPRGHRVWQNGELVNQAVHGNDYWQTDFDPVAQRWSRTYNLHTAHGATHTIRIAHGSD